MRRSLVFLAAALVLLAVYVIWTEHARADATLSTATAQPAITKLHIRNVCLDFDAQAATVYYNFQDATGGIGLTGGSVTIPFPQPAPGILGAIRVAAAKSLCGYSSGSMGQVTPVAIGTAIP